MNRYIPFTLDRYTPLANCSDNTDTRKPIFASSEIKIREDRYLVRVVTRWSVRCAVPLDAARLGSTPAAATALDRSWDPLAISRRKELGNYYFAVVFDIVAAGWDSVTSAHVSRLTFNFN